MSPVGEGPGSPGSPGTDGSGRPGLAVVHALIVVVPPGATVTGPTDCENGDPVGRVPVTVPPTVAVLDPLLTTKVAPEPEEHVPGVMVGSEPAASPVAVTFKLTLDSAGVCWQVEFTHTWTGTLGRATGPALADTVCGAAVAVPETASEATTIAPAKKAL